MKRTIFSHRMLTARYLLSAHIGPFVFSLGTLMFLFMFQFVMKFIDQLIGKGLSAWIIIELIALSLAWMVVLAVPMAVLVATLMAFGELSSRNEITAMKASGMSIYRMLTPIVIAATAYIALVLVWFNNFVLPEANHQAKTLMIDIRKKKPTLNLAAGLFSQDIAGYSILVRKTFEKTNDLEGITLYDYTNPNTNVLITAERGKISFSPDYRKVIMDLEQGEIHELDLQRMSSYRRLRFHTHRIAMNAEGFEFERSSEGAFSHGDRELSAKTMAGIVDSLRTAKQQIMDQMGKTVNDEMENVIKGTVTAKPFFGANAYQPGGSAILKARSMSTYVANELSRIEFIDKQSDQYLVEIYKKYSIPAACIVFVLIGVPLGIMARRGGFGAAATLSLGFFLVYWAFLIGGEKLADRDIVSPFIGMWSADIVLGLLGIYLTIRIGKESVVLNWSFLQHLIPKRWRAGMQSGSEAVAGNS